MAIWLVDKNHISGYTNIRWRGKNNRNKTK